GFVFVRAYLNYSQSGTGASPPLLGVQVPIVIGIGAVLLGLVLMIPSYAAYRGGYFRRRPEVAAANALELAPVHQPHLSRGQPGRPHTPPMTTPRTVRRSQ
ncbi:MAG: hypothetical protein ACRDNK_13095, partial [Solirubrobacteraceae bacterium]